ncbi:hypothetical protein SLS56_001823 [Neofusicoccum ribis]|uniref:Uncharacterized protein n=1 Tax=Neofusicoccum ribis TaxID=45134 RepID=A0ABR3T746_9PEZI
MMCASTENPPDCLMWSDALAAKYDGEGTFGKEQWDQLLGHCQVRKREGRPRVQQLISTQGRNWRASEPELRLLSQFDWGASHYYPMLHKFWTNFFKGSFEKYGKEVFNQYYAEMRATVPAERLLEYHISEGWEPLCEFLEVPVPKVPFPHVNDTKMFKTRCRARNRAQLYNVLFRGAVIGSGCIAGIWMGYSLLH